MRINYDYLDLEAFLAVAETSSFVIAAEQLGASQSAISRRIQKLETAFGTPLFDRTTRSVRATLAGKRLKSRAKSMLDDAYETIRELRDETTQFEFQNNSIVTVAAVPSAIPLAIIQSLTSFGNTGNLCRVRIMDLLANEVVEAVSSGEADFGVSSIPVLEANTTFEPLFDDQFVVAFPNGHAYQSESDVKWASLVDHRLVLPMKGSGNRMLIDTALAKSKLNLFWSFEVPRTSTALEIVGAGLAVAALPFSAIPASRQNIIETRNLIDPTVERTIGLVTRKNALYSNAAKDFMDTVIYESQQFHTTKDT